MVSDLPRRRSERTAPPPHTRSPARTLRVAEEETGKGASAGSPKRKRLALYLRFPAHNLTGLDLCSFFQFLLRHLRGPVVRLGDRGAIHRREEVKRFLGEHPRVHPEFFPAYAPELNPAEFIWTTADGDLSSSVSEDLAGLYNGLRRSARRLGRSQKLLWSCIYASDLPWTR